MSGAANGEGSGATKREPEPARNGFATIPAFVPGPSSLFAEKVLKAAHASGALIGPLAVWAYLADSRREFTKDLDIAVSRASLRKIRDWLLEQGYRPRELPIGGVKVRDPAARIDVDFIERSKQGDLSGLFEEAVEEALASGRTARVEDGAVLALTGPEYLVAMKMGAGEDKDERDARSVLGSRNANVDVEKLRGLADRYLGVAGANRLEAVLRQIHHPAARPDYSES